MRIYNVFTKKEKLKEAEVEIVSEGFSIKAFVFSFFWLVYNQLWIESAVFLLLLVVIKQVLILVSVSAAMVTFCIIIYFIGISANDFLCSKLRRSGYKNVDIIFASSEDEAKYKFLAKVLAHSK